MWSEANSSLSERIMSYDKYSNIFLKPNGGYFLQHAFGDSWGIFSHSIRLDQSRANETFKNIWWIIKQYIGFHYTTVVETSSTVTKMIT